MNKFKVGDEVVISDDFFHQSYVTSKMGKVTSIVEERIYNVPAYRISNCKKFDIFEYELKRATKLDKILE